MRIPIMINKKLNAYFNCHLNWVRIIGALSTLHLMFAFATFGLVPYIAGTISWIFALVLLPFTFKFASDLIAKFTK